MGKEIIRCGLKIDDKFEKFVNQNDTVYLVQGKKYTFYIEPTEQFFEKGTLEISKKFSEAKWAYIMDSFFDTALKKKKGELYTEWGIFNTNRGVKPIEFLGIGNQYKQGAFIEFYFDSISSLWIGTGYRVEVFNEIPNAGLFFTIVPCIEKYLRYAFFEAPANKITIENGSPNDGLLSYNSQTFVEISIHRFGKSTLDADINPHDYNVELYLCDDEGNILEEKAFLKEPLSKYVTSPNAGILNNIFRISFTISEEWKNNYHEGKDYKKYSLEIHIVDTNKNTYYSFNIAKKNYSIMGNSGKDEHNVSYLTQNFFVVKKSALDIILLTQQEKTNMIQYIGDVNYSYREFDPCGFSKISIKELGNTSRTSPYIVFEEGKSNTNIDKTFTSYDIITGDEPKKAKKVEITVEGLTVKGVLCQSVLLDKDKKHSDLHNVFQTGRIWTAKPIKIWSNDKVEKEYPTKIDNLRVYKPPVDPLLKKHESISKPESNYENKEFKYKKDKDHKGETGTFDADYDQVSDREIDGAAMLEWKENDDFVIKDEGKSATFTLQKVVYVYDKKIANTPSVSQTYSATEGLIDKTIDSFWMFNYFWLSENLAQTYFLPISTCRYPNQIAQIRVFPDIEWEFKLQISSTQPEAYSHTNMPAGDIFKKHQEQALKAANNKRWLNEDVSFELAIKAKTGDFEREVSSGYADTIKEVLNFIVKAKETLDNISGVTEARKGMAAGIASKLPGFLGKSPITFQIDYPVISITANWKLDIIKGKPGVARTGTISFGFTPLIKGTGKLDLIACLEYLPVAGPVFKAVRMIKDAVNEYTPLTADIWFNLYAFGQLDFKGNIVIGNEEKGGELEAATTLGIGAELGVKASAEVPKISFNAPEGEEAFLGFEAEGSAKGETSLVFAGKHGISNKGVYFEMNMGFGGMVVYVTGKAKVDIFGVGVSAGVTDKPYQLLKPVPELIKGRHYFIENKK